MKLAIPDSFIWNNLLADKVMSPKLINVKVRQS